MKQKEKLKFKKKNKPDKITQGLNHAWLIPVLVLVAVSISPTLSNGFVNWDDIIYVMNNDMIHSFSRDNLVKMFSTFYMGNYHPLTLLSFTVDYSLGQLNPYGYHMHNLILHLVNVVLVYLFSFVLLNKEHWKALLIALIFGIHPMHVESVAWISERKDLLYSAYFFAGLIFYLLYLKSSRGIYLFLVFISFLLSLLSKAQAVTFPLALMVIDYYQERRITFRSILVKVPLFLMALAFGLLAIYAQKAEHAIQAVHVTIIDSMFFGLYGILVYLFKFLLPVNLTCLYNYPLDEHGSTPLYIYFSPLVLIGIAFLFYKTWNSRRYVSCGLLFFLLTILPVLQFMPVGQAFMAERYTYIPYFGLIFTMVLLYYTLKEKFPGRPFTKAAGYAGLTIILLFSMISYSRTAVWKDSTSLWSDVIEKNPRSVTAYVNRSYIYLQEDKYKDAIADCNTGITIDSNNYKFYGNRAFAFKHLGLYQEALNDFTKAINKKSTDPSMLLERGIIYTDFLSQYDKGIADFRKFLIQSPGHLIANLNIGIAYLKKNQYDSSLYYCQKVLAINEETAGAHYVTALIYESRGKFEEAYKHGSRAKQLGYNVSDAELEGWRIKAGVIFPPALK